MDGHKKLEEIRNQNFSAILNVLREKGARSLNQIAEHTAISLTTVKKCIEQGLRENMVCAAGEAESTGGRKAMQYLLNREYQYFLFIITDDNDLGCRVFDFAFHCVEEKSVPFAMQQYLQCVHHVIAAFLEQYDIGAVCLSLPCVVKQGIIIDWYYNPGLCGFDIQSDLSERFHIHVIVRNDMKLTVAGACMKEFTNSREMPLPAVREYLAERERGAAQDSRFEYRLLDRLRQDCDYYLGGGERAEKHLWAGDVEKQIAKMRELYRQLPAKPEWLTEQDINEYERRMTEGPVKEEVPALPAADMEQEIHRKLEGVRDCRGYAALLEDVERLLRDKNGDSLVGIASDAWLTQLTGMSPEELREYAQTYQAGTLDAYALLPAAPNRKRAAKYSISTCTRKSRSQSAISFPSPMMSWAMAGRERNSAPT